MYASRQHLKKLDVSWALTILRSYLMTVESYKWVTQGTIEDQTGLNGVIVRQVCQAYPAMFVSSTSGYKLAQYATTEQIQHCVASLLSRSEKMIHRASALSGRLSPTFPR